MAEITVRLTSNPSRYYAEIRDPNTGVAGRTIKRLALATAREADRTAPDGAENGHPQREGHRKIRGSHRVRDPQPSRGGKFLTALVINDSEHARFVARGTGLRGGNSAIFGNQKWEVTSGPFEGNWMTIPRFGAPGYTRGQNPNPWIVPAYNAARQQINVRNISPMTTPRRTTSVSIGGGNPTVVRRSNDRAAARAGISVR